MNINNYQNNLLNIKDISVYSELWDDYILYIHPSKNPWKFPKNNGSGDYLPTPSKFNNIIKEFNKELEEQTKKILKLREIKKEIKVIYSGIKEKIKETIDIFIKEGYLKEEQTELKKGLKLTELDKIRAFIDEFFYWDDDYYCNIDGLLTEWKDLEEELIKNKHNNNTFILKDDFKDGIQFCFQPDNSNFTNLIDYIWYRNGICYEIENWQRFNNANVIITAK